MVLFARAAIIGLCLAAGLPTIAAAECRNESAPPVQLQVASGDVRYIESADRNRLRRLHGQNSRPLAGWGPIGLTVAELGLSVAVSVRSELLSDGRYCSTLNAVDATVGYDVIDVYIAREYPRGSCQYSVILDHERRHVVVFQSTLDEYVPTLQRLLEEKSAAVEPIMGRNRKRAARKMQTDIQTAVKELLNQISKTLDVRNARLDTGDRYRQEQEQCLNW
ncbi:MAG: hypothetical protein RIC16_00730 [Rhodospirillales bacterium]